MEVLKAVAYEGLDFLKSGELSVHSSFRHAVNLKSDAEHGLFSIVSYDKTLAPNGVAVECSELPFAEAGTRVEYKNGSLLFKDFMVDLSHAIDANLTVAPKIWNKNDVESMVKIIESVVADRRPGLERLENMKRLERPLSEIVGELVGLGPGLTPSGDDFICGWLWAWRSCGDDRFEELAAEAMKRIHATTDASANFIRLACSSRFAAALKIAQNYPEEGFEWMAEQGSTSGIDTLFGARFGLWNSRLLQ